MQPRHNDTSEFPNFPQRNLTWDQIETFVNGKGGKISWHIWAPKQSSTNFELKSNWSFPNESFVGTHPITTSTPQLVDKICRRENLTSLDFKYFLNKIWPKNKMKLLWKEKGDDLLTYSIFKIFLNEFRI